MMIIKNTRAIIFDMDGTLTNSISYHKEAWIRFLKKYNIYLESNQFNAQNHGTIDEMIIRFFGDSVDLNTIKDLGQEKERIYRELYRNDIKEIDGLTNFLIELKSKNIKIGLATNCDTPNIDFVLESLNIKKYFDVIIGGHEVVYGKPNPEIYISILNRLGIMNHEAIVIEDSEGGILSALKAGINVVGITTSHNADELRKYGCYETIDDFKHFEIK